MTCGAGGCMTPCRAGGLALGFLIFSCSWCCVCMHAHTEQ